MMLQIIFDNCIKQLVRWQSDREWDEQTKIEKAKAAAAKKAERQAARDAQKAERLAAKDAAAGERQALKAKSATLLKGIKAIKAKGAKMTDADKTEIKTLREQLLSLRGGTSKKVAAFIRKAQSSLNLVARIVNRHEAVAVPVEGGLPLGMVLDDMAVKLTELAALAEQATFVKPVKAKAPKAAKAAKAKAAKAELTVGTLVVLAEKVRESYEDLLDVAGEYRVVKVVGKKAVIVGNDGVRSILPSTHLVVATMGA
jgi:hypothetical protein